MADKALVNINTEAVFITLSWNKSCVDNLIIMNLKTLEAEIRLIHLKEILDHSSLSKPLSKGSDGYGI